MIIACITFLAGFLPETTVGMVVYHIVAFIYHITAVCIVYLMIEANNDSYTLFINRFCCRIIQTQLIYDFEDESENTEIESKEVIKLPIKSSLDVIEE